MQCVPGLSHIGSFVVSREREREKTVIINVRLLHIRYIRNFE